MSRAKSTRLGGVAGGQGEGSVEEGRGALLLYLDPAGRVHVATAAQGAGIHDLLARDVEMHPLSDTPATAALVAAARRAAWVREAGEGDEPALTLRERQVLWLVARGLSNQAVAEALDIRTCTVRFHLRNTYAKLGLAGRRQAIAWAVSRRGH